MMRCLVVSLILWPVCPHPAAEDAGAIPPYAAGFKKGSGIVAGTARRVLLTTIPDPFLNPSAAAAHRRDGDARPPAFWPQYHGPRRDNCSTETGLLKSWPPQGPKLVWTARGIGAGFATVSIAEGLIYTAGNIGDKTVVTAIDLDGGIQWQAENGPAYVQSDNRTLSGSRGCPTVDGDRVYHESPHGHVGCLDAHTGKRFWSLNILERFGGENITWALSESLLVDGDRVICSPGAPDASVVALNKRTGEPVWISKGTGDKAGYSSPILVEHRGLRQIVTMTAKAAIGVHADTGRLLWRFEHVTPFDENIVTPVFHDGHILIESGHQVGGELLRLNVSGNSCSVDVAWRSKALDSQHGGVLLFDGYLYGATHQIRGGSWTCLDFRRGEPTYTERGIGKGSLTYADGCLHTLNERGTVALVPATPNEYRISSQFQIPDGGDGPTWAHPVVCGGRLYVRHGDFLYAYDLMPH